MSFVLILEMESGSSLTFKLNECLSGSDDSSFRNYDCNRTEIEARWRSWTQTASWRVEIVNKTG